MIIYYFFEKKGVLYADLRMLDTFLMNENVFNQVNL